MWEHAFEARDSTRYCYATGWANIAAVADRISVLAFEGKLSAAERDEIHGRLREAFCGLDHLFEKEGLADEDSIVYSDGSPVYSIGRVVGQFPSHRAGAVYCGDLGPADELEPGEVIVAAPPHLRRMRHEL